MSGPTEQPRRAGRSGLLASLQQTGRNFHHGLDAAARIPPGRPAASLAMIAAVILSEYQFGNLCQGYGNFSWSRVIPRDRSYRPASSEKEALTRKQIRTCGESIAIPRLA